MTLRLECAEVARYCKSGSAGLFKRFVGSRAGMLAYRGIGHEGQTFEEEDYPDVVARVYDWAMEPKMLQLAEEAAPTAVKRHPGRNGPRAVGDGEGLPIRPPPPFSASRFLRPGKCGPYSTNDSETWLLGWCRHAMRISLRGLLILQSRGPFI